MMTTKEIKEATKCYVNWLGNRAPAYADKSGIVRVYDSVAGHFVVSSTLTPGQERYVRAKSREA